MDSHIGKSIRLGRIMRPETGRGIVVASSHPVLFGPVPGLSTREEVVDTFSKLSGADAVMCSPGTLAHVVDLYRGRNSPGLVIHMDWMNSQRPFYPAGYPRAEGTVVSLATVEELVQTGADGFMTYLYVGHEDPRLERDEIERNARLARECAKWGIVLIIEPQPAQDRRDPDARKPGQMAFYARVAADIGADIVKSDLPAGDTFEERIDGFGQVTSGSTVPVMLAGGPMQNDEQTFELASQSIKVGGAGLVFGRKIYQSPDPAAMLDKLAAVVHG